MKTRNITISLPINLIKEGKKYAKENGATFSGLLRIGLEKIIFKKE